jgi:hypothetical protein
MSLITLTLAENPSGPFPSTGVHSASDGEPNDVFFSRTTPSEAASYADSESFRSFSSVMEQTPENSGNSGSMLISFKNLQKRLSERGPLLNRSKTCVELLSTTLISDIREILISKGEPSTQTELSAYAYHFTVSGFQGVSSFKFFGSSTQIDPTWTDVLTEPILITSGPSCSKKGEALKINENETLASYFSRINPSPVQINLSPE